VQLGVKEQVSSSFSLEITLKGMYHLINPILNFFQSFVWFEIKIIYPNSQPFFFIFLILKLNVFIVKVLCQAQSGLSVSDLLNLTWGDIKKQLDNGSDHIHLRLLRGKEKQLGFHDTFLGRRSVEALTEYLPTRKDSERLFPIRSRSVNRFLERASRGLGWRVSSHDLRKFFSTSLKLARVNDPAFNESLIEYWMGHSLGRTKGAYLAPPVEDQLRLYKLAQQRLEPPSPVKPT